MAVHINYGKKLLNGADSRERGMLCKTLIIKDLRANVMRHLQNVCEWELLLSKEREMTPAVKIFHFILVQIRFRLTDVILNISKSHDDWFFLYLPKAFKYLHLWWSERGNSTGNVCKAVQPNEWKVLLQHFERLLTIWHLAETVSWQRWRGLSGAAVVAEHISSGHPVPKLSGAQSNAGTPALRIKNALPVGNGTVGFHTLEYIFCHWSLGYSKNPLPHKAHNTFYGNNIHFIKLWF